MSISAIKTKTNNFIRTIITAGGILKTKHSEINDDICDEIAAKGIQPAASTAALSSTDKAEGRYAYAPGTGLFRTAHQAHPTAPLYLQVRQVHFGISY